jgi:hypothetical protein
MANGAFKFKDNSGNVVSFISGSGSNIAFSGGTLDLSGMTGLTLGNLTLSGTTQNALSASHAASYLLTSSFNTYSGTTDTVIGTLQTSTSSLNSFTSSATTRLNSIETSSGSLNSYTSSNDTKLGVIESTTGSLNSYTSSNTTNINAIHTSTGSLNSFTSSATTRLDNIEGVSGSYATTGSNLFKGNQTISGSIIPAVDNTYDLGSVTHQFRDLYLSSASLYIDGTKVLSSTTQELQITTDTGQSFKILEAGSDNITLQSADGNIELKSSGGGDVILDPTTGVIALKGTTTLYAGNKILSSDGNAIQIGNGATITGSLIVTGFIETQELRTTYISSSILYRSGSTKFGDELTDTHAFTGSLLVSGSISVPESNLVSGSSQLTGSYDTRYVLSGSITQTTWDNIASKPNGIVSGSVQVDVMSTTNIARLATTGSNVFTSNQIVTGSISSTGNISINSPSTTQLNIYTSSVSTQNVMGEFWNGDYTSNTRNFIRVRNAVNSGSTMSSYFGQGQDGKTYIVSNDFTKNHIVIDGNSTFVGINKNTPNSQLDVNGNTTVTGSLVTTGTITIKSGNGDQLLLNNAGERFTQINLSNNSVSKANIWWDNTNTELVLLASSSGTGHLKIASNGNATFSGSVRSKGMSVDGTGGAGFLAQLDGNNSAANGAYFGFVNAANSRYFINQLDANNDINYYYFNGSSWSSSLIKFSNTGAATFGGSITATNIILNSINSVTSTAGSNIINSTYTGINGNWITYQNAGGILYAGLEDSTSSSFGATAYAGILYLTGARNFEIFTSSTKRLTITSTGTVQPGANGTQDLGTSSLRWGTVYTSDLSLSNGIGDYTIVEGEEKLYLYNNKNNKVYSFVLQEEDPSTATPKKS